MRIIYDENINLIKDIVIEKAQYQKVMLLYDDSVSNNAIYQITESVKQNCIFNKMNVANLDVKELFNGYRAIIYLCDINSFLNLNFDRTEFFNIYVVNGESLLPYYLNNNKNVKNNDIIFLTNKDVDVCALPSVFLNRFYTYIDELYTKQTSNIDFVYSTKELTQLNVVSCLERLNNELAFVDLQIAKECGIDYKDLPIVDIVLINAFMSLLKTIKYKDIMIVDVYKTAKDDSVLIDKLYALNCNNAFLTLLTINYNQISDQCLQTKNKIIELISGVNLSTEHIDEIIKKVSNYAKQHEGILSYLYLYDIFNE